MNYADRARQRAEARERMSLAAPRGFIGQRETQRSKIHHYLLGDKGVSFAAPFDGSGLPSHNVVLSDIIEGYDFPTAAFNVGYRHSSTFPKTLDPSQLNNVTYDGDSITVTLPNSEQGIANAVGFYWGLRATFSQHAKIYSAVPAELTITRHFTSNATSSAFSVKSKFGKTRKITSTNSGEWETTESKHIRAGQMLYLNDLTHAAVKIPQPGEVDNKTGFPKQPQFLITDRVTIEFMRK